MKRQGLPPQGRGFRFYPKRTSNLIVRLRLVGVPFVPHRLDRVADFVVPFRREGVGSAWCARPV
jgi:hypothetical protein